MRISMWVGVALATSVLTACGGGGGGEETHEFEVAVKVDGVADDSNPLTNGEATTINVASGATLVFDSEIETRWSPSATSSSYEVKGFSFTSKSLTVDSNAGGTLSIVFSDKADASRKATLTVNVAPKEFQPVARLDGQVETWSETSVDTTGGASHYDSLRRTVLMDNGNYAVEFGDPATPDDYSVTRSLYDAQDRYLGFVNTESGTECFYDNPVTLLSYPLHVGKSWSGDAKRVCGLQTFSQHYSRTVEAFEQVVVPQGKHDALRIKSEAQYSSTFSDPDIPPYSYTMNTTCWWAVDLGRNVKCTSVVTNSDGTTYSNSGVMTGLAH